MAFLKRNDFRITKYEFINNGLKKILVVLKLRKLNVNKGVYFKNLSEMNYVWPQKGNTFK